MKNSRLIFGLGVFAIVLWMSLPELKYYPLLSQGDHGRDLYAAQAVLRGELPYKDFWWVYGPLMPYYYAFFYKFFGATIGSFLLGKLLLKLACSVFFYLAASELMGFFYAFLASLWFAQSQQDFFFTFNHLGGIACQLWILYMLFAYLKTGRMDYLWRSLPAVFIFCLVKVNFGLASLGVVALTALLSGQKKKFYWVALAAIPAAIGFIYWLLLKDLPFYAIRQCMPYFGDDQPYHATALITIPYYFLQHWLTFRHGLFNSALGVILHGATLIVIGLACTGKINAKKDRTFLLSLGVLGIFFVLNFHEFIVTGIWYRTYWSLPFLFMFHFLMMVRAFSIFPKIARIMIWVFLSVLTGLGCLAAFFSVQTQLVPPRFLNGPHARIYAGNEPQWTQTVNTVNEFLDKNLKKDELFFALPYDCIYYYLTSKPSPTRQLIFFDHIKIPLQQEIEIIKELSSKNVRFVLLSNRMASNEHGLGIFGKTYCPLLSQYIAKNFTPFVRQGGNWQTEPGWANNHGIMILKKNGG